MNVYLPFQIRTQVLSDLVVPGRLELGDLFVAWTRSRRVTPVFAPYIAFLRTE